MPDFWRSSGFHLLKRDAAGHLRVTDDFLRAYLHRPEVRPTDESCPAERALHAELLAAPRETIGPERLAALADADARENYAVLLAFRDRLVAAGTVEACYLSAFRDGNVPLPLLFVDQMAHVILRNLLGDEVDGLRARAGELLFRTQKVTTDEGRIMVADAETVDFYAESGGLGDLGRLIVEAGTPVRSVELDVLDARNAELYFGRDERHDTVLDLSFARPALDALARVLEAWVRHFLGIAVSIQPVQQITDERWVWHTGLDAESSGLLNDLYKGATVEPERLERLLFLFRLEFADPTAARPGLAGRPVYLGLAMTAERSLRLKPQNLLVNLPLATPI
jgi:hypothetical protein